MNQYTKEDICRIVEEEDVEFIRLQFCDIFGMPKNMAITASQLEKALNNECMFDGSSIEGFVRMDESDMYLYPDTDTFDIYPWRPQTGKVARLFCDVYTADRKPFTGDPRYVLKRVLAEAKELGYTFEIGPELEFFLFHTDDNGLPTTKTHETAGYFDVAPSDLAENVRRDIVLNLEALNFEIEASHHEIAPAQHEIDFKRDAADRIADMVMTFKMAVKTIAKRHGLYATFMPKPKEGVNGSGMHINISCFDREGKNVFFDEADDLGLSETAYHFIAGVLAHMKGISLVTNPLVNSYKRLVPGYDAPVNIAWSGASSNRSALLRVPTQRGERTRIELRSPDAACNPYLAFALCLAAGLEGIRKKMKPGEGVETLPETLGEAIEHYENDALIREVLGDPIYTKFLEAKEREWKTFRAQVTNWEIGEYLNKY